MMPRLSWRIGGLFVLAAGLHGATLFAEEPVGEIRVSEKFVNVHGGEYQLPRGEPYRAVVLIFYGHDCPISNGYAREICRLHKEYSSKKISFCIIYAEADLKLQTARRHAKEYGFPCPVILDPKLTLARKVGATIMPEAAVLSATGKLLYRGRIDNLYADFGKRRVQATSRELKDALDALLANKPIAVPRTQAIGCDIDFPDEKH